MAEQFPELKVAYVGPNASHRQFRTALANAKALAYVLAHNDARVLRSFQTEVEAARKKSRDGSFAIGVIGRGTTTSAQLAIHITSNEADLIAAEPAGFVSQSLALLYREVYRVFETFLVNLFEEIALKDKRVLFSSQRMTHEEALRAEGPAELQRMVIDQRKGELTRVGFAGIEKAFSEFGLPVIAMTEPPPLAEQQNVHLRLQLLSALRNIIEHNRSVVNEEFLRLVPDLPYKIGERVAISVPELGDALSAVEWTANRLNQRAIKKFALA